jgi:Domain of unknown function (DUF4291)
MPGESPRLGVERNLRVGRCGLWGGCCASTRSPSGLRCGRCRWDRAVQIGLTGEAARRYVNDWTVGITDVTRFAAEVRGLAAAGDRTAVSALLSAELPYPLPDEIRSVIGAV